MKSRIGLSAALLGAFILGLVSVHPIAKAMEMMGAVTCASSSACAGGTNTGKGPGLLGSSTKNNGVNGQTTFVSTSKTSWHSGVLGADLSTKGKFDVGVTGRSTNGTGILGQSTSLIGVNGISNTNTGVWGQVNAASSQPTGVVGIDASGSKNGAGVAGQSKKGAGVVGATLGSATSSNAIVGLAPSGGYIFLGAGANNTTVASIDSNGNMFLNGQIYTGASCVGCSSTRREASFGETAASPTIEDSGEAQLIGGASYVRLDPSFERAIDARQGYYVLITPEADTRGLYVAQRMPAGFYVRENAGGRSSGQFAYRIVAHPFGVHPAHLPFVIAPHYESQVRTAQ